MVSQKKPLSPDAIRRLTWLTHYTSSGNARQTCRLFGISPSTFYHWKKKYDPANLLSLEDTASRRPKTARKTKWNYQTLILIKKLLEHKPYSRNREIQLFLTKQGVQLSASTMTRIMKLLRRQKRNLS